jgi:DNA-directed RNA polymerase subunit K/omega
MADSEENTNLNDIFVKNLRSNNKTKSVKNTPQTLYVKNGNDMAQTAKPKVLKSILKNSSQLGGKTVSKQKKSKNQTDTETSLKNESDSESDSETESGSGSESDSEEEELNEDVDPNEEPADEYEVPVDEDGAEVEADEEVNSEDEEEDEEAEEGAEPETEYNEEADAEKDTEMNADGDIEECLYQYDDLVEERDSERLAREIPKDQRKTDPQMTHYERIRILGVRSKQIAMGAKVMIKYDNNNLGAVELAKYELNKKTTPLVVKRPLPDNSYELWEVSELLNDEDPTNMLIRDLNDSYKNNQTFSMP